METTKTVVGSFTMTASGTVEGPAAYMASPHGFAAIVAKMERGESAVLAHGGGSPASVLVAIQTHYAGWRGMEQIRNMGRRSR